MPSVLLIRPLCEGEEPEFAEPLGIERLAGYLLAHGVKDVAVFDRRLYAEERRAGITNENAPGFYDDIKTRYAQGAGPEVIGLSLMTSSDVPDARRIVSRLRSLWPQAVFCAGGVYVTTSPQEAAQVLPLGVQLIHGEGEASLLAFALHGALQARESEPALTSPNEWAVPYRPYPERYARLGCAVNMQTSRGCSGACTFCATPQLPDALRRWQPRDLELVAQEVQTAAQRLSEQWLLPIFNMVDDDFGPLERLEAFAELLTERQITVAFACEMRLASLASQKDLAVRLHNLKNAGLTRVFFGVESVNPQTLQTWHKPSRPLDELPQVLAAFREAQITVQPGYILWHKGQTLEEARKEVAYLHTLGIYSHRAALSRLIVFDGCALAQGNRDIGGFERMDEDAEQFYRSFSANTADLTHAWTQAAIKEPYVAAQAHLTGDTTQLEQVRETLRSINERSYTAFMGEGNSLEGSGA